MTSPSNLRISFSAIGVTVRQKSIFKLFSFSSTHVLMQLFASCRAACGMMVKYTIHTEKRNYLQELTAQEEGRMELSLRLDTLGMVEMRYLRSRDRYRDWPSFQLLAASRQARVMAFMSKDVAELLHQQILLVESAVGLDEDDEEELESEEDSIGNEIEIGR